MDHPPPRDEQDTVDLPARDLRQDLPPDALGELEATQILPRAIGGFEILDFIGRGGMGEVYRARQAGLERVVALKVLSAERAADRVFSERFLREAKAAAALQHPNVVRIIDTGVDAETELPYAAFELIEGDDLEVMLKRDGRQPERRVLEIALAVARALEHAHAKGIVHRDVKPANILVTAEGVPKLADLGLVKRESIADTTGLTSTGVVIGTPHYMSPEQANADDVDIRTDLYALGTMLFELSTATRPFQARTPVALLAKKINEELPDPRTLVPELSESFVKVVQRLAARDREQRYATPTEAIADIETVLAGTRLGPAPPPVELSRVTPTEPPPAFVAATGAPASPRSPRPRPSPSPARGRAPPPDAPPSRSPVAVAGAILGLVAIVAVSVIAFTRGAAPRAAGPAASTSGSTAAIAETPNPPARHTPVVDWRDLPLGYPRGAPFFIETKRTRLVRILGQNGWLVNGMASSVSVSRTADRVLATAWLGEAVVWEAPGGRELFHRHFDDHILAGVIDPDGRRVILGTADGSLRIHDLGSGEESRVDAHETIVSGLDIAADGRRVVSAAGGEVAVWDLADDGVRLTLVHRFDADGERVAGLAISGDGTRVASVGLRDGALHVWDVEGERPPTAPSWSGRTAAAVHELAMSTDGTRVVTGPHREPGRPVGDRLARVWSTVAGATPTVLDGDGQSTRGVAILGDRVVTGSFVGPVFLWDLTRPGVPVARLEGHRTWVQAVTMSAEGSIAITAGNDGTVRRWQLDTRRELPRSPSIGHVGPVVGLSVTGDGTLWSGGRRTVVAWRGPDRPEGLGLGRGLTAFALGPGGVPLVGDESGQIVRVDPGSREATVLHGAHAGESVERTRGRRVPAYARTIVTSPDGETVVSVSDAGRLVAWSESTGAAVLEPTGAVTSGVAFLRDGRLVTLARDGWELATRAGDEATSRPRPARARALAAGSDGASVGLLEDDGTVRIGTIDEAGELADRLVARGTPPPAGLPCRIAVGLTRIAASAGTRIELFDARSGEAFDAIDLSEAGYQVTGLRLSTDELTLWVGTSRGRILVFQLDAD